MSLNTPSHFPNLRLRRVRRTEALRNTKPATPITSHSTDKLLWEAAIAFAVGDYKTTVKRTAEAGNILFLILLAVVLFAALSYAVTSAMRGDGKSASSENAELLASQIIQYATGMNSVITRMRIINSCDDTQISFQRDWNEDGLISNNASDGYNPNAPTNKSCHVFDPAGGAYPYQGPPSGAPDPALSANAHYGFYEFVYQIQVPEIGTTCADSSCAELLFMFRNVNEDVCQAINDQADIDSIPVTNMHSVAQGLIVFRGSYAYNNATSVLNSPFNLRPFGCARRNDPAWGTYNFYMVLIER